MGGAAPAVDGQGDVWVSVGTVRCTGTPRYDDSDSVLDLSPSMRLLQYFAPGPGPPITPGTSTCPPSRCCCPAARCCWPASPPPPTCSTAPISAASAASWPRWRPACDGGHRRRRAAVGRTVYLPCVAGSSPSPRTHRPACGCCGVRDRRRPAHRGRRPGLDDQPDRHPVRARPADRPGAAAGRHRRGGEPLPDRERGRGPAAGPGGQPGGRVPGRRASAGPAAPAATGPAAPPARRDRPGGAGPGGGGLSGGAIAGIVAGAWSCIGGAAWLLWRRTRARPS